MVDGNDRYDKLLMQNIEQIQTDVSEGRRESAEFRTEITAKVAALDVQVENLGHHMTEDAKKNRKSAQRWGAFSGAVTATLAVLGIHLKS